MIKIPFESDLKKVYKAREQDRLTQFLLLDGTVRGAAVHNSWMLREMAANHRLGPAETWVLGRAYTAALLWASSLKGLDRLVMKVQLPEPWGGWSVEANAFGEVRGYLYRHPLAVTQLEAWDEAEFYKQGTLTMTRFPEGKSHPRVSAVELVVGPLDVNLEVFSIQSEQIDSCMILGNPEAIGQEGPWGGLLLQALPGADPAALDRLFTEVRQGSPGRWVPDPAEPEAWLSRAFPRHTLEVLGHRRVEFSCHCSRDRFGTFVASLPPEEKADILEKGPFPLVTTCHNCNTAYEWSRLELEHLFNSPERAL